MKKTGRTPVLKRRKLLRWVLKLPGGSWQMSSAECSTAGLHLQRSDYTCLYCTESAYIMSKLPVQMGTGSR